MCRQVEGVGMMLSVVESGSQGALPAVGPQSPDAGGQTWCWTSVADSDGEPLRDALARRDIGKVFSFLRGRGMSVNALSRATGMQEHSVRAVCGGKRTVQHYDVLVRIAEGLCIPRDMMGLGQRQHQH
ncbi:helix-turn-helix domain-containing protein [Catellatospora tritici]|uniref:helix-turn-helix domain-containing protein n=1 Tax=Catellatospora tritici TaxID=2851566 RepID=UPI001C2D0EE9|nr:helix-turn-helix domain-containing protein [Catellatospora tritici]MBV1850149.1 helix-turn-helix domain-containing protein [Catellatospora tritici]